MLNVHSFPDLKGHKGQVDNTDKPENLATKNFKQWLCKILLLREVVQRIEETV
jgi:hypothetical protein